MAQSRAVVLKLLSLADHLINFDLVRGPPLKVVPLGLAHCG